MARVISANGSFLSLLKKARIQNPKSSVSHAVGTALFKEPLPGVLGNRSIYFQGTGDIVKLFSGNRATPDYIVGNKGTPIYFQ